VLQSGSRKKMAGRPLLLAVNGISCSEGRTLISELAEVPSNLTGLVSASHWKDITLTAHLSQGT